MKEYHRKYLLNFRGEYNKKKYIYNHFIECTILKLKNNLIVLNIANLKNYLYQYIADKNYLLSELTSAKIDDIKKYSNNV